MEIILRERPGKKRDSLILAMWNPATKKWQYENLHLFLYHLEKLKGQEREQMKRQNDETMEKAKIIRGRRQEQIHAGEHDLPSQTKREGNFILFFERLAMEKGRNYKIALGYLKKFTGGSISFSALNEAWAMNFQKYILKSVPSNNYAWMLEARIRAGIHLAMKQQMIARDFLKNVKPIRFIQRERTFLTSDEIGKLIATPCDKPEIGKAFLFSVFSGLRFSDILRLTWKNIDGDYIRFSVQKTKQAERIPLNANAREILLEGKKIIPMTDDKIFSLPTNTYVNQALCEWARKAGIKKHLTFHVARHTFAALLLTSGVSIFDTQKLLAHKSISMTMLYSHMIPEELKQRVDEKMPVFKINGGTK